VIHTPERGSINPSEFSLFFVPNYAFISFKRQVSATQQLAVRTKDGLVLHNVSSRNFVDFLKSTPKILFYLQGMGAPYAPAGPGQYGGGALKPGGTQGATGGR